MREREKGIEGERESMRASEEFIDSFKLGGREGVGKASTLHADTESG